MRRLIIVPVILMFNGMAVAQSAQPADSPEPTVLAQRDDRLIVQLPNRLIVIAQRIAAAPVVSVHCWVKTGSIYEQQHNGAGLSHFLEHLVSAGSTDTRTEAESNAILGAIGAQTNAATSLDTVRYYINTTSDHADTAIMLLSDWMQHAKISDTEYQRERDVIQREFDMGQGDPGRIYWKLTQQARYRAHPARHPTIGYLDEFLSISRDEIYDFYKLMYVPNNCVFIVAGDVDPRKVVQQVAEQWRDSKPGELPKLSLPVEPPVNEPTASTGHADVQRPRLRLAWPGTKIAAPHDYALDLLAQILGDGELSRLVQSVRNRQGLVTSIDAYNASFTWGEGFFGVDAVTTPEQMDAAQQAILAEVQRIRDEGVTDEELARAKAKTVAAVVYSSQTAEQTASRLAGDFIGMADPDYLQHYAAAIQKLTPADLAAAAHAVLRDDRIITIQLLPGEVVELDRPEDQPLDAFPSVAVNLDNSDLVRRFKSIQSESAATAAAPRTSAIQSVTLDNGLRVLIQQDTRLPIVAMNWFALGGLLADEAGHEGIANAMATMMIKGAADMSADDIAARLESIGADLSTVCGNSTFYAAAQCLSNDWPDVLALLADVVQRPTFPDDQWKITQPRILAAIDAINDRWSGEMIAEFEKAYYGPHPWSRQIVGRREVVEQLTAEQLRDFHSKRLAAADSVLVIVGDIDPRKVEDEVRRLFSTVPAEAELPFKQIAPTPTDPRIVTVQTAKPLTAVQIGYAPGVARNSDDYAPMLVLTKVVSNFPSGWIHQALRGEGPGLAYASFGFQRTGIVPGYWAIAFNTSADAAPEAISRSLGVVQRLRNESVDEDTLARSINAAVVDETFSRQSNSQRAMTMALDELYRLNDPAGEITIQQIRATTPRRIQELARKYLNEPVMLILSNQAVDLGEISQTERAAP